MESSQNLLNENQKSKISTKLNRIILLSLFLLLMCSIVFAYTQRLEAQQQKERSDYLMEELLREKADAEQAQVEATVYKDLVVRNQNNVRAGIAGMSAKK